MLKQFERFGDSRKFSYTVNFAIEIVFLKKKKVDALEYIGSGLSH